MHKCKQIAHIPNLIVKRKDQLMCFSRVESPSVTKVTPYSKMDLHNVNTCCCKMLLL